MSADIRDAKRKLPLPALLYHMGLGETAKKSARCPFHDDRHNSFSIWQRDGVWFWKCHAGCGDGDEINFLELHERLSRRDATKRFLEMAGVKASAPAMQTLQRKSSNGQSTAFDWQQCVSALKPRDLVRLGNERWYSRELCEWLKDNCIVGIYDGAIAFPVHDQGGHIVAAHVRQEDGSWRYYPKGMQTRPLVIGELLPGDTGHVFESQWDGFSFMDVSGERSGVILTRGSSNGALVAGLIPAGTTVYAWKQNDELKNGKRAGDEWLKDICSHGTKNCTVKVVKIPAPHKDLNDWTRAAATDKDLVDAMRKAEVVREAEKSWTEALNESVVTSNELRDLHLTPRKKLLGDWFCEGDLGFIFAYRGVGKTWFTLAIAQALSTGGKLGDWQAHAPVKVLYIDGEMPPDLMRTRCQGLQASNDNLEFLNHEILFERTGKVLNITNREIQQAITERCIRTGINVLILDNLSTLASGMRENEADSWELVNNITVKKSAPACAGAAPYRVVAVGDTIIGEQGLVAIIGRDPRYQVCGAAHSFEQANKLVRQHRPDLLLIEPFLENRDAIRWIRDLATEFPRIRILVVTRQSELTYAERALHAGASGYWMKNSSVEELMRAIETVLAGEIYASQAIASLAMRKFARRGDLPQGMDLLSNRELAILSLIAAGHGVGQIARDLGVSRKTIECHCEHIKLKLGYSDAEALRRGARELLDTSDRSARNPR